MVPNIHSNLTIVGCGNCTEVLCLFAGTDQPAQNSCWQIWISGRPLMISHSQIEISLDMQCILTGHRCFFSFTSKILFDFSYLFAKWGKLVALYLFELSPFDHWVSCLLCFSTIKQFVLRILNITYCVVSSWLHFSQHIASAWWVSCPLHGKLYKFFQIF